MSEVSATRHRARDRATWTLALVSGALVGLVAADPAAAIQAVTASSAGANATVDGIVFSDTNGNGIQDQGEQGLQDVSVSDGVTIVQTDSAGRYELETDSARRTQEIVFVTQPAGYWPGPTSG